jgi:hypothetical protein
LKDFIKVGGHNVKFADIKDGRGIAGFELHEEAERALENLNNTTLKTRDGKESTVSMTIEMPAVIEEPRQKDNEMESDNNGQDTVMDRRYRSRSRGSRDE